MPGACGTAGRRAVVLHSTITATAPADERDTLAQADAVACALRADGWRSEARALGPDLAEAGRRLTRLGPDLVFNLVESIDGDSEGIERVPEMLAANALPFTGCDGTALAASTDKLAAKALMRAHGIPTPPVFAAHHATPGDWIVKPVTGEASVGLDASSVVSGAGACAAALAARCAAGGRWFAERYVEGREFNVSLLGEPGGPRVLPIAEMRFVGFAAHRPRIVDYAAKWDEESFGYRHTHRSFTWARREPGLAAHLARIALACWDAFALSGYARVDLRADTTGAPWVLEVNANPCLTPDAGFVAAAAAAGIGYTALIAAIASEALAPRPEALQVPSRARPAARRPLAAAGHA